MKPAPETSMALAFAAAGIKLTGDKLMDVAMEAWTKWSTLDGAGARTKHVSAALQGEMTWALINQYGSRRMLDDAISRLLNDAKEMIASQQPKKKAERGRLHVDAHERSLPGKASGSGGHASTEPQRLSAVGPDRKGGSPPHETQSQTATLADKHAAASAARLHVEMRLADKILINGKALRRCTVGEVRAWADERQRVARSGWRDYLFAQHLIANLPGNEVIGQRWRDNEIEDFYARAGEDYDIHAQ